MTGMIAARTSIVESRLTQGLTRRVPAGRDYCPVKSGCLIVAPAQFSGKRQNPEAFSAFHRRGCNRDAVAMEAGMTHRVWTIAELLMAA